MKFLSEQPSLCIGNPDFLRPEQLSFIEQSLYRDPLIKFNLQLAFNRVGEQSIDALMPIPWTNPMAELVLQNTGRLIEIFGPVFFWENAVYPFLYPINRWDEVGFVKFLLYHGPLDLNLNFAVQKINAQNYNLPEDYLIHQLPSSRVRLTQIDLPSTGEMAG